MAEEHVDLPSPPLHVYGISTPQTATIHFDKIFKNVEEQTSITFKKISESRNEVVIASERSFAEAAVKVCSVTKFNFNFFFAYLHIYCRVFKNTCHAYLDWYVILLYFERPFFQLFVFSLQMEAADKLPSDFTKNLRKMLT